MQTKALLINPAWKGIGRQKQAQFKRVWPPLGLSVAGALLERDGISVRILDNNIERLSSRDIGRLSMDFDSVFVTSTPYDRWQCPSLDISFFLNTVTHIPKDRLFIMGAHVTERPGAILKATGARAAILGEPEKTVLDLARMGCSLTDRGEIDGIAYMRGNETVSTPPRSPVRDLDSFPYPAFHLLDMARYRYEFMGRRFAILEASRGCPFQCSFCYLGMYGRGYRHKSVERVLGEVRELTGRYNVKNIYFMDLEFGLDREFLLSLCSGLEREGTGLKWCCQTRVSSVDGESLKAMARAGCSLIHFGVEAGSPRILAGTGKGITLDQCERAVQLCRVHGIRSALFMNFGFPGERLEDMEETIRLAVRLNPTYASFHLIVPFPGTELARDTGLDPDKLPVHLYPQYNSADHDLAVLKQMLRRAYVKFYLRPSYLRAVAGKGGRMFAAQAGVFARLVLG
jgi:radical SAM superfamily enzyme YgiQ (UPF0313 family)